MRHGNDEKKAVHHILFFTRHFTSRSLPGKILLKTSFMGCFYVNYTLRGPNQDAVAAELAGRAAIVSPEQERCVVVYDEESESQDDELIRELASRLSGRFQCPLLAVLNHDDDILKYWLFLNGELMDEYDSTPGYFGGDDEDDQSASSLGGPEGGNANLLCRLFEMNSVAEIESILRRPAGDRYGYIFAIDRHTDLVAALGITTLGVAAGYELLSNGEIPEDLDERLLLKTKDLIVPPRDTISAEKQITKPKPGYYKVSFRAAPGLTRVEGDCAFGARAQLTPQRP